MSLNRSDHIIFVARPCQQEQRRISASHIWWSPVYILNHLRELEQPGPLYRFGCVSRSNQCVNGWLILIADRVSTGSYLKTGENNLYRAFITINFIIQIIALESNASSTTLRFKSPCRTGILPGLKYPYLGLEEEVPRKLVALSERE